MIKVLITGADSYIGTSFERWCNRHVGLYAIKTVDMKGESWKDMDFSDFDVVFHVAGIAHVSQDPKMESLYYKVNRDLAIETARKAKSEGVRQFVFMSSIIVYGESAPVYGRKIIDKDTVPNPTNFYGKSKLQAEKGIFELMDDTFSVAALRPPMVYGKGSKGNYPLLAKFALKLPFFPDIDNERSIIYIDNLCEFIRLLIDNQERGVFFPQNSDYVKTSLLVKSIVEAHGRKIILTGMFNPIIKFSSRFLNFINKVFGNLVYEKSISEYKTDYRIFDLEESVRLTEIQS